MLLTVEKHKMNITISTMGFLDYIFQGLTAIGTIGAVITSLYFSQMRHKINAKGTISFKLGNSLDKFNEIMMIEIINNGEKPFRITSFYIRAKKLNLNFVFFPDEKEPYSTRLDFNYVESSNGQYIYPKEQFIKNIQLIFENNKSDKTKLSNIEKIKYLKFYANTNLDQEIILKPQPYLLETCIDYYKSSS